jgi:predicted DNA-binding transcriptional regulator AlpA
MKTQARTQHTIEFIQVIRHEHVCSKLNISSSKLFDMVAKQQFIKPFTLIPGGRAVGWLEQDVDQWILSRKEAANKEAV